MAVKKKTYSVTIDIEIVEEFKARCKEQDINQSMLIEAFMRAYTNDMVELRLVNSNKIVTMMKE